MNTVSRLSLKESTTESSTPHRYSLMCVSLYSPVQLASTEDLSTWLAQDFPVSHFHKPEAEKGEVIPETCGQPREMPLLTYNRITAIWRTSQGCLLTNTEDEFSGTWPSWGLMLDGACWEQLTLAPPTGENVCGLLPTPTSTDFKGSTPYQVQRRQNKGNGLTLREWLAKYIDAPETVYPHPGLLEKVQGWPIGWTELKPLETAKFHKWLKQHGSY